HATLGELAREVGIVLLEGHEDDVDDRIERKGEDADQKRQQIHVRLYAGKAGMTGEVALDAGRLFHAILSPVSVSKRNTPRPRRATRTCWPRFRPSSTLM